MAQSLDPTEALTAALTAALRLEPGGIYVIQMERRFRSQEDLNVFNGALKKWGQEHGDIQFLVLEPGMKIARAPVSPSGPAEPDQTSAARTAA